MIYNKKLNIELNKQGIQGAQGEQGPQGPKGDTGATGAQGKNAIVMTSATTPNGEYNGQLGMYNGQFYTWNGSEWVLASGILPTDPVLHYSFDELPEIPDGTAITHFKGNTYNLWQKGFGGNNVQTVSNNNGKIHVVANGQYGGVYLAKSHIQGNSVVIVVKVISGKLFVDIQNKHGMYQELSQGTHTVKKYFSTNIENNLIFTTNGSDAIEFEIEEVYIGDASYTTPVIDNSGNNYNATTTKGISVQGISGKGLQLTGNSYVDFISPLDFSKQIEYSCSCWIKDWDNTTTIYVMNNWQKYAVTPNSFRIVKTDIGVDLRFEVLYATDVTKIKRYTYSVTDLEKNSFVTLTVTKSGVAKLYVNGNQLTNYTTTDSVVAQNSNIIQIGRSMGDSAYVYSKATLDDFMLFNRALSDQEVLGLYLSRGNTPKRYTLNDYRLNLIDDDSVISVSEKKELLRRWKEIYNAENVSSVLPTSNISSKGEYKAVIDSANSLSIGNITAITNYKESANALRDAFWGSNGYLVNMTTASTLNGSLDSLFANYKEALQNANNVISDQQSTQASAITVQMASPFVQLPVNDSSSVTSYDNSGNVITVLIGAVTLTPVTATATLNDNQYSVTASGSGITAGSVSVDATNKKVTIGNSAALTKSNAQITYTIKFKINGTTGTLYAQQKISTATRGADGKRGPMYRGTTKPTTDVVNGDWYLDKTDNLIHVYNNSNWNTTVTNYNDYQYKPAINDMIEIAATNPNVPFLSATNAWIKNLAAGNILADEIATKELKLTGNGVIKSEKYVEGEFGFKINSNGDAEFNKGRFRGGIGHRILLDTLYVDTSLPPPYAKTLKGVYIPETSMSKIIVYEYNHGFYATAPLAEFDLHYAPGKAGGVVRYDGTLYDDDLDISTIVTNSRPALQFQIFRSLSSVSNVGVSLYIHVINY